MAAIEDGPHGSTDMNLLVQAAKAFLEAEDGIIGELPIPAGRGNDDEDLESAEAELLDYVLLNTRYINDLRFRNARFLLSAGLPSYAIKEFSALSSLTFDQLDEFYCALCLSFGPRKAYDWYAENFDPILQKLPEYEDSVLSSNLKMFAATCMACALENKDYGLAEHIADSSDSSPPYEHKFLEHVCIVYWLLPHRQEDAGKWSEIAIANDCPSAYPHLIKCRSLLSRGDFQDAIDCLDRAERFFYVNGLKEAYAAILHERSTLMEGMI